MAQSARTDIGFQGGQVLSLRTADEEERVVMGGLGGEGSAGPPNIACGRSNRAPTAY